MALKLESFTRKTFQVEAVRVTKRNMYEVAKWCDGRVRKTDPNKTERYIKVKVLHPLTDKQTMAFVGDWVLETANGYKVYTDAAFHKSFDALPPDSEYNTPQERAEAEALEQLPLDERIRNGS